LTGAPDDKLIRGAPTSFKDHFSSHADRYAAYRPTYPRALMKFLADCCENRKLAWDCATGNGQTAVALTPYFDRIVATDASEAQICSATHHPRIEYRVGRAEASSLENRSADLITVSQALHWFDIDRFFDEVMRVLVPGGVFSAWSYELCAVEPGIDAHIFELYRHIDDYWPPERRIVEAHYRGIELPMPAIAAPRFEMTATWKADAMLGYLRTWSACQRYLRERGTDPVDTIEEALRRLWGAETREVRWPLALKIGRA
jgi:SAM-dependent methyltransferase